MYPIGALIAGVLLGATLTIFAVALRALDRTVTRVGDSILSGLVTGFHTWSDQHRPGSVPPLSPRVADPEEPGSAVPMEPVRRSR